MAIKDVLPQLRRDRGLTQAELASKLYVTRQAVSRWENGETTPNIDMTTHSYDFALALEEIALWSDHNPNHLPILLIVEPKVWFLPTLDMDFFTLQSAHALDRQLNAALGDRLVTPADVLRGYDSGRITDIRMDGLTLVD